MTDHRCDHCHATLPAAHPRWMGAFALGLAYTVTFAFAFMLACTGPAGIGLLPFFVPGAIGMITSAHTYAGAERICPACGKLADVPAARVQALSSAVAVRA